MLIPSMGDDEPVIPGAIVEFVDAVISEFSNKPEIRARPILDRFRTGNMAPLEAICALAPLLREQERIVAAEQTRLDDIKGAVREAYMQSGEQVVTLPEHTLELTYRGPSVRVTADHHAVRRAITTLREIGDMHGGILSDMVMGLAADLEAAIRETQVAGGVVVGRPKK